MSDGRFHKFIWNTYSPSDKCMMNHASFSPTLLRMWNLLVLRLEYSAKTRSIPLLLMPLRDQVINSNDIDCEHDVNCKYIFMHSVIFPWVLGSSHNFSMKDWWDHIYMGPVGPWKICSMLLTYHAGPMDDKFQWLVKQKFLSSFWPMGFNVHDF